MKKLLQELLHERKLENSALPSISSYLRLVPRLLVPSIFSFNNVLLYSSYYARRDQ